jgi:hypothetical protein
VDIHSVSGTWRWCRFDPSHEEYLKYIKTIVGDDSLLVEILSISKWFKNEIVAECYSDGNMRAG